MRKQKKTEKRTPDQRKKKIKESLILAQQALKNNKNRDAITYYTKAAKLGDTSSQCFLGSCYLYGMYGTTKNQELALKWYRRAAKQGNKLAQEQLSRCFANGTVGKNKPNKAPKKSAKWYRESKRP